MPKLPLTPVADVTYNLPAAGATRLGFDLGLIVTINDIIDPTDRVVIYDNLAGLVSDGFSTSSETYLAATRYFNATSKPSQLAVGVQVSGESCLDAVQACRAANLYWYIAYVPHALDEDHEEIAAYMETLNDPYSMYYLQSEETAVRDDDPGNLFDTLKTSQYKRSLGLYSTSDYAIASLMGYVMGQTSNRANSAYTLKFKTLPGAVVDDLTAQQVANIEGNNGNVYVNRGNFYNMVENGKVFSGDWFDEIIYLDKLANAIQINVANLLYQTPKIPQTEGGVGQLKSVINSACGELVNIGFIAPGEWKGGNILTLAEGDWLPSGFVVLSEAIIEQSSQNRADRVAPTIYVAANLAGAIQSVVIEIDVNR